MYLNEHSAKADFCCYVLRTSTPKVNVLQRPAKPNCNTSFLLESSFNWVSNQNDVTTGAKGNLDLLLELPIQ